MALSTDEMRFDALSAPIPSERRSLRLARHGFQVLSGGRSGVSVRPARGEDVSKVGRSAAVAPSLFINSKPQERFALPVESPLSPCAAWCPQQTGDGLAGDRTMRVLRSQC
jgi:hypothetical protein